MQAAILVKRVRPVECEAASLAAVAMAAVKPLHISLLALGMWAARRWAMQQRCVANAVALQRPSRQATKCNAVKTEASDVFRSDRLLRQTSNPNYPIKLRKHQTVPRFRSAMQVCQTANLPER